MTIHFMKLKTHFGVAQNAKKKFRHSSNKEFIILSTNVIRTKNSSRNTADIKDLTQLKRCLTGNMKTIKHEQDMKEDIQKLSNDKNEINTTVKPIPKAVEFNTTSITSSYANITAEQCGQRPLQESKNATSCRPQPNTDLANILIVENVDRKDTVKSSSDFEREISRFYPRIKVEHALALVTGNVFLNTLRYTSR